MCSGSEGKQEAAILPLQNACAQNNVTPQHFDAHVQKHKQHPPAQQVPMQASTYAWQQQQLSSAHQPAAVQVSGVFTVDDDFDDAWMNNHVFQAQAALRPPASSAQQQQSIMAMPVIDLSDSPAHKKAKS